MLLMHGFGALNMLILGNYILRQLICMSLLNMAWHWNINFNENVQPSVDWETATK